eukprot:6490255-Amphidinium_carterae.2
MEVEMEDADNNEDTNLLRLKESTLSYIVQIDGDMLEDIKNLNTLQDIDDDLQSQVDLEHEARERCEDAEEDPQVLILYYAHYET